MIECGDERMITERIDAITNIPQAYRAPVLPAPRSVKIELSPRCNYRCGFCALRTREKQPRKDMDWNLYARVVREMRDAGVEELGVFFLGESCMNPDLLVDAIAYAKLSVGMPYVFLTTNGSLMTPDLAQRCMQVGLDSMKFSVNADSVEQFKRVMAVKPSLYEAALRNLRATWEAREAGRYSTRLYASSIRYDGEQQQRMESMLREHVLPYVDEHYWLPLYSMGAFASQREAELGYRPTAGNQGRLGALREPLPCWSAFTEGHVRADGGLSACCFDAGGEWLMGDLTEQTFMDAWNSQAFQSLRSAHLRKDVTGTACEKCVAYS